MINSLVVYDKKVAELGSFFEKCGNKVSGLFRSDKNINIHSILDQGDFSVLVPLNANQINTDSFIFTSFTHGGDSELLQNGRNAFISTTTDFDCLKKSFSYCFACKAGRDLAQKLIDNGTLAFIGYKNEVSIQIYFGAEDFFIDCAVVGIEAFLAGMNVQDSADFTIEVYNDCIDEFYRKDMLTASLFMDNRDSLVIYGNKELSIYDFISKP